jgi:hypothetical protein
MVSIYLQEDLELVNSLPYFVFASFLFQRMISSICVQNLSLISFSGSLPCTFSFQAAEGLLRDLLPMIQVHQLVRHQSRKLSLPTEKPSQVSKLVFASPQDTSRYSCTLGEMCPPYSYIKALEIGCSMLMTLRGLYTNNNKH